MKLVLSAVCLLLLAVAICPADKSAGVPWVPSQSYEGSSQYDPRLDRQVHLWGAGMLLADVFDAIESQTEVVISCTPPGNENERVPVSLFLNPEDPPTLRAVLAQLSWVLDCNFFCQGGEGQQTYLLLHTSIGGGAAARLHRKSDERIQARLEIPDRLRERLAGVQEGLALSREEAIQRYRGKDDALLLTLLDPQRRAGAQVVCRHTETVGRFPESFQRVLRHRSFAGSIAPWGDGFFNLSQEDLADLMTAFGLSMEEMSSVGHINIETGLESAPRKNRGWVDLVYNQGLGEDTVHVWTVAVVGGDQIMSPEDQLALRRLLGETLSESQAESFLKQCERENAETRAEQERRLKEAANQLSTGAQQRLAAVEVPLTEGADYLPWAIQEQIAKATGLNIIADALCWIEVRTDSPDQPAATRSAAAALEAMWHPSVGLMELSDPLWEWGDAGTFLRFRAADRDVWRAAAAPPSVIEEIDRLPTRVVGKGKGMTGPIIHSVISRQPEELCHLFGSLTDLQHTYGRYRNYGDPSDARNLARHAFLAAALQETKAKVLRFGDSLTSHQWRRLREGGLTSPDDLTEEQVSLLAEILSSSPVNLDTLRETKVIWRLGGDPSRGDSAAQDDGGNLCLSHGGIRGDGFWIDARPVACFPSEIAIHVELPTEEAT